MTPRERLRLAIRLAPIAPLRALVEEIADEDLSDWEDGDVRDYAFDLAWDPADPAFLEAKIRTFRELHLPN